MLLRNLQSGITGLLIIALCTGLCACNFSPTGSHFEDVNPTPSVIGSINLNEQVDTLFVRGSVNFTYSVDLPGRNVHKVQLFLGSTLLKEGSSLTDSYYFNSSHISQGTFQLKLVVVANSGTGSLADKLGAEGIQVYTSSTVVIDNGPPSSVSVTSVQEYNGQLLVKWDKYKRLGFRKYYLHKGNGISYSTRIAEILDINTTSYIDPNYLGGPVAYVVVVEDDAWKTAAGKSLSFYAPLPTLLDAFYNKDSTITVKFTSTPFYNNLRHYQLNTSSYPAAEFTFSNYQDTVVTIPFNGIGASSTYTFRAVPKGGYWGMGDNQGTFTLMFGESFYPYTFLYYSTSQQAYYLLVETVLYKLDGTTLEVLQKRELAGHYTYSYGNPLLAISADGAYLYAAYQQAIHQLDPITLETIQSYPEADLLGQGCFAVALAVSNNNRLVVRSGGSWYQNNRFLLFDFITGDKRSSQIQGHDSHAAISPDGNICFFDRSIKLYQGNTWSSVEHPSVGSATLAFHPTQPFLYISTNGKILEYSTGTGAHTRDIITDNYLYNIQVDPVTGYLSGSTYTHLMYYDLTTGKQLRIIKHAGTIETCLLNNRIFSPGSYVPLQ